MSGCEQTRGRDALDCPWLKMFGTGNLSFPPRERVAISGSRSSHLSFPLERSPRVSFLRHLKLAVCEPLLLGKN